MYRAGRIGALVIAFGIPAELQDSGEVHSLVMIMIVEYLISDPLRISCI